MNYRISLLLLAFFLLSTGIVQAQKGVIKGIVKSAESGETLIGAAVIIKGSTIGMSTGIDGDYSIEVEAGTYDLVCSFISFETQEIKGFVVKANSVNTLNFNMKAAGLEITGVSVEGRMLQNTENAVQNIQRESVVVMDAISAQQISRMGDGDAGAAVRRVTGVSVEGGKYLTVRGLGDRYSKTALNGIEIPSLDPDRNAVQMDMLPTNLLDNIQVVKTFSPDLPGNFSGGYVNLITKDFPDEPSLRFTASLGFNDQATFNNNYINSPGGNTDLLGFDDGSRDIPAAAAAAGVPPRFTDNERLDEVTASFNKEMVIEGRTPGPNMSYALSGGNHTTLFGKKLGYLVSLTYSKSNNFYDNGSVGRYNVPSASSSKELNTRYRLDDKRGSEEVLWGVMTSLNYRLSNNHSIGLNLMRNQNGESSARYLEGQWDDQALSDNNIYRTQTMRWLERSYSTAQLRGNHIFGKLEFDWKSALTLSEQKEPDLRFFTSDYVVNGADTTYNINTASYPVPSRYFRDMSEVNYDAFANLSYNLKRQNGLITTLKSGGALSVKERDFDEQRFDFRGGDLNAANGDIAMYLMNENIDAQNNGLFVEDATERKNSYTGYQVIPAVYAMVTHPLSSRFKVITGARVESTYIEIRSKDENKEPGIVDDIDILPAFNLNYDLSEKTKLRLSMSQTIARPTFRELAPYAVYDFVGGYVVQGNPDLERTQIQNFDLRWETYPNRGEYLSLSAFYKKFESPIALAIEPRAANDEIKFVNLPNAIVYGVELEMKKSMNVISPALKNLKIGANATLIYSESDIEPLELQARKEIDPSVNSTRPMYGQSPYLINAFASFEPDSCGLSLTLSYNMFGERLAIVSKGALPDVYEQPAPTLDLVIAKTFSKHFNLSLKAGNLLNSENKLTHTFRDTEYIFSNFTSGRTYSISLTYSL